MLGGAGCRACFRSGPISVGGVGAAKGLLPGFLVPKGNQPTACTLALWWLKFGLTEGRGREGVTWRSVSGGLEELAPVPAHGFAVMAEVPMPYACLPPPCERINCCSLAWGPRACGLFEKPDVMASLQCKFSGKAVSARCIPRSDQHDVGIRLRSRPPPPPKGPKGHIGVVEHPNQEGDTCI